MVNVGWPRSWKERSACTMPKRSAASTMRCIRPRCGRSAVGLSCNALKRLVAVGCMDGNQRPLWRESAASAGRAASGATSVILANPLSGRAYRCRDGLYRHIRGMPSRHSSHGGARKFIPAGAREGSSAGPAFVRHRCDWSHRSASWVGSIYVIRHIGSHALGAIRRRARGFQLSGNGIRRDRCSWRP